MAVLGISRLVAPGCFAQLRVSNTISEFADPHEPLSTTGGGVGSVGGGSVGAGSVGGGSVLPLVSI